MKKVIFILGMLAITFITSFAQTPAAAPDPGITVFMYRKVSDDKRAEFIKRETTYWAEVAKKSLAKGNITFWALLEKVGGYDMENSSNFLFINTYKNIDAMGEVWNSVGTAFPNVPIEKIETNSISTTTSVIFLRDGDWQQAANANNEKDMKYISMIYHNATDPGGLIELERKHWGPFIKSSMDKKQTTQKGWGNAVVLSPTGVKMGFNTVSYDLYPTVKEALMPTWDPKTVFPAAGLEEINKLEKGDRSSVVYEVIKVVSN